MASTELWPYGHNTDPNPNPDPSPNPKTDPSHNTDPNPNRKTDPNPKPQPIARTLTMNSNLTRMVDVAALSSSGP